MNKEEAKVLAESMTEMGKISTVNTLECVKAGFEAFKKAEIPRVSQDGQYCYGVSYPYKESKEVQNFVDFMIIFLDEAIKELGKKQRC